MPVGADEDLGFRLSSPLAKDDLGFRPSRRAASSTAVDDDLGFRASGDTSLEDSLREDLYQQQRRDTLRGLLASRQTDSDLANEALQGTGLTVKPLQAPKPPAVRGADPVNAALLNIATNVAELPWNLVKGSPLGQGVDQLSKETGDIFAKGPKQYVSDKIAESQARVAHDREEWRQKDVSEIGAERISGALGINAEDVKADAANRNYIGLAGDSVLAAALALAGGKQIGKAKGGVSVEGTPGVTDVTPSTVTETVPALPARTPADVMAEISKRADEITNTNKASGGLGYLSDLIPQRVLRDAPSSSPLKQLVNQAAERKAELGHLSELIPTRQFVGKNDIARVVSEAEKSANPIESAGAKAVSNSVELEAPEIAKTIKNIQDIKPLDAETVIADSALKNQGLWGQAKTVANRYVLQNVAGYLTKQGDAGKLLADGMLHERARAEATAGRWSADYIQILGEDLLGMDSKEIGPSAVTKAIRNKEDIMKSFERVVSVLENSPLPGVKPNELRAAERIRGVFDNTYDRLSAAGVEETIPVYETLSDGGKRRVISKEFEASLMEEGGTRVGDEIRIPIQKRQNYWPHMFDAELLDRPQVFAELRKRLVESGVVSNEALAEQYIKEVLLPRSERLAGNAQHSRVYGSKFYRKDPAVALEYFAQVSKKMAELEVFGKFNEMGMPEQAAKLLDSIRAQGGDYAFASRVARRHFNKVAVDRELSQVANSATSWLVASQMATATIANASQVVNALWRVNAKAVAEAFKQRFTEKEMAALRDGGIVPTVHNELMSALGLKNKRGGLSFWKNPAPVVLEKNQFLNVENWNRVTGHALGRAYAKEMLEKIVANPNDAQARAALKDWMGLDPDRIARQRELYDSDLSHAGKFFTEKVNFRSGLPDLPYGFQAHPVSKLIFLYKSFGYNQARLFYQAAIEAYKTRNLALGAKMIALPIVAGELVAAARNLITGREREDSPVYQKYGAAGRALEDMSYAGGAGLLSDYIMNTLYDKGTGSEAALKFAAGPAFGKAADLTGAVSKDVQDAFDNTGRKGKEETDVAPGVRTMRELAKSTPGFAPVADRIIRKMTESESERKRQEGRERSKR